MRSYVLAFWLWLLFVIAAPAMAQGPVAADELIVLRAENNLLRQQALRRDAELAAERQRALVETLRREIGAAAVAAGLDPDGYVLDIDKRQWIPKAKPATPAATPGP